MKKPLKHEVKSKHRLELIKIAPHHENKLIDENPHSYPERLDKIEKLFLENLAEIKEEIESIKKRKGKSHTQANIEDWLDKIEKKILSLTEKKGENKTAPKASSVKVLKHYVSRILNPKTYKRLLYGLERLDRSEFDEFGRDPKFEQKLKPIFDFLYYRYWRVFAQGLEHIPNKGPALIVANHSGSLPFDGSMIRLSVSNEHPSGRDVRFLVEDFVYYLPFIGTWMYRIGGVRAAQENAERLLLKNHLVAVFPEGEKGIGKSYKHRYHLQRFGRGGFIKLALRTGVPIIPCAVIGAEETHPLLYRISILAKPFGIPYVPVTATLPWLGLAGIIGLPAKWKIVFGKPIHLNKYGKKAIDDELLIHRLSEQVRQTIQQMIKEELQKRQSIWFY